MKVLNNSIWSSESLDPSYISPYSIQNFARRGKKVTWAMN